MGTIVFGWIVRVLSATWLMGPIFDKEMRVSSRRRRNYVLRFLYILLFAFLLTLVWVESVPYQSSAVYQSSRMAQAGQVVVTVVLWFEFLAAQAIAVVMLSTSISDEICHRTLGVLMTTPISAFQVVLGKLLSKLLQLALLLAISLPLLAIVRVLGGVPWDYLVGGLCVTLTTSVFVGSLSLLFSIFTRRAYSVVIITILAMTFLFLLLPTLVAYLAYFPNEPPTAFLRGLSYVNPYFIMEAATLAIHAGSRLGAASWPGHCAAMLGASSLALLLAMVFVRRAALRQAMGQVGLGSRRAARRPEKSAAEGRICRVMGPPVLWKECRLRMLGRRRLLNIVGGTLAVGFLCFTYVMCYLMGTLGTPEPQLTYLVIFFAIGMLFTIVLPATCITSEKESQTWPLLLTTSLSEWAILGGKFGGVLRRCAPAWLLLFVHVAVFVLGGIIHPVAILQLGLVAAWVVLFLAGTGLCFGLWLKHTTAAVIANMSIAAGLWAILPLLLGIIWDLVGDGGDLIRSFLDMNPFVQAAVISVATTNGESFTSYDWVNGGMTGTADATGWILLSGFIHVVIVTGLVAWAGRRMRRHPL